MHAIELADLATSFVRMAFTQRLLETTLSREAATAFWLSSRYRHDEWSIALAKHRDAIQHPGTSLRAQHWQVVLPVIQEVLLSEPLTRAVAYHVALMEGEADPEIQSLVQSVFSSHMEARHRCLHLIVFGQGLSVEDAVKLNRLRRTMETLTDSLLEILGISDQAGRYCFELQRLRRPRPLAPHARAACVALQTWSQSFALRGLRRQVDSRAANSRLNLSIAQSVLRMFGRDVFDGHGVCQGGIHAALSAPSPESTGGSNDLQVPLSSPLDLLWGTARPAREDSTNERSAGRWN